MCCEELIVIIAVPSEKPGCEVIECRALTGGEGALWEGTSA